jgi:hypothetical protein
MAKSTGIAREIAGEPPRHLPTERQCALLIVCLIRAREEEFADKGIKRKVSRARLSQNTIRKLCGRSQISNDFLLEMQEYLLAAGWALFCVGATHYAIIRVESVHGWSRISSRRIADKLKLVQRGEFRWEEYEYLLVSNDHIEGEEGGEVGSEREEPDFDQ